MKSILLSAQPQWIKKILNGEKTIEIRKSAPKCELPIEVFIYCTKGDIGLYRLGDEFIAEKWREVEMLPELNGKVVAKFTLKEVDKLEIIDPYIIINNEQSHWQDITSRACLSDTEIAEYLNWDKGYAWHISDLEVFDKPMELGQFKKICNDPYQYCQGCKHGAVIYPEWVETSEDLEGICFETVCLNKLKRPSQSWQYVEV